MPKNELPLFVAFVKIFVVKKYAPPVPDYLTNYHTGTQPLENIIFDNQ